jgi:mono/diheme cytochrome c family protein
MRAGALILVLALTSTSKMCGLVTSSAVSQDASRNTLAASPILHSLSAGSQPLANSDAAKVDFTTHVKPIFQARCQPCHFSGGVMYQRLPFDRPETIKTLGEKLFTRIKDENERRTIRQFLAQ